MMNKIISAIIPCYNVKKDILEHCIDSILSQNFHDFEVIIVNDGSDDYYVNGINEVANKDSRIKVINQNNYGASSARNIGLQQAKGEYITFIDADDTVVPYFFSEAYQIAVEYDADYVVGCVYHTEKRNPMINRDSTPFITVVEPEEFKPFLINVGEKYSDGSYFGRGPVARIIRKGVLKNIYFQEDVKLGEDIIWNLDVISKCTKIYMVRQIWYIYWENMHSITRKYNPSIVSLCETHLHSLIKRIDLNNPRELTEYCLHIGDLLYRYVFECYYGSAKCPMSVYKRYSLFSKLCKREPWSLYQTVFSHIHCNWKIKIRCLLIKFNLLYWLYYIKDHITRESKKFELSEDELE